MRVDLGIPHDDSSSLSSLRRWILRDDSLRERVEVCSEESQAEPGTMGDALDIISLALTSSLALPAFIQSVKNWRETRRAQPEVSITVGPATVVLAGDSDELTAQLVEALQRQESQ
ncbi:hypothetical protein ACFWHV_09590 [Streptomyces collinus]|uniref:effector-associated constant component EACC1 n=1 Tax=Streptomyces collinus TaxID=42684 RepID=UPI0036656516